MNDTQVKDLGSGKQQGKLLSLMPVYVAELFKTSIYIHYKMLFTNWFKYFIVLISPRNQIRH